MKIIYGTGKIEKFKKAVVALGVFDGIHIAHRRILEAAVKKARSIKGVSVVLTFFPHPQKEDSLSSLEHRLKLIAGLGIDICIVINFDKKFSRITAQEFIREILAGKIGARHIYVGNNFRFGKGAKGDYRLLKKLAQKYNFRPKNFGIIKRGGRSISSTYIRKLIGKGKFSEAQKLLARPVSVLGTVIKGSSLARRLGFPTANIDPHHEVLPPAGIYAVQVIFKRRKYPGVCYIGTRPTIIKKGYAHASIEAYIFNFNKNIYGEHLEIQFIHKLRNEKKFPSLTVLAGQVKKDILKARKAFLLPT